MKIESVKDLIESNVAMGDFLYFWGHSGSGITKSCLSQWYDVGFKAGVLNFKTAEHYMMYCKAQLFKDAEMMDKILAADTAAEVKSFGRSVKNYDDVAWDEIKRNVVFQGNLHKFEQNPELKEFLLSTRNKVLVEASPYDNIWGIGMKEQDPAVHDPKNWKGQNLLGFALMKVRRVLKADVKNKLDALKKLERAERDVTYKKYRKLKQDLYDSCDHLYNEWFTRYGTVIEDTNLLGQPFEHQVCQHCGHETTRLKGEK